MKLPVAASILSSSVLATAESLPDPAGETLRNDVDETARESHRNLAVAMERKRDITAMFKERRASKKQNGGVIRNLRKKSKSAELRNQAEEDVDMSDADLDLGLFSRNLQQNSTEPEEANAIEKWLAICGGEDAQYGLTCSCSDVDLDMYTLDVSCSYDQNCLDPYENPCGNNVTFCYVQTYELEIHSPGLGSITTCYEVNSPIKLDYCFSRIYSAEDMGTASCRFEFDGTQCSSCEFTASADPDGYCYAFDCNNIDEIIGAGTICDDNSVLALKLNDYIKHGELPCPDGCNICPGGGEMMNLDETVMIPQWGEYDCSELNYFAQSGSLKDLEGDLCNAFQPAVNEPCECVGGAVVDPIETPNESYTELGDAPYADDIDETPGVVPNSAAATSSGSGRFVITAVLTSFFSWVMA